MSFLDYGRHVEQLRRRRRRAYAPTSNTASLNNHDAYGAPLGGPSGRRAPLFRSDPEIIRRF